MTERFETENEFGSGSVLSWASIIEGNTREQAEAISRVPIVEDHVALMPDAHFGFGPPVGSVVKTRGGVMPYAVGVDIGCGMIAMETQLCREDLRGIEGQILGSIRRLIPSGVGQQQEAIVHQADQFVGTFGLPNGLDYNSGLANKQGALSQQFRALRNRLLIQFGTLGAGNHFVEVCEDAEGRVWLLLHSGSRGIGNILATAHVHAAQEYAAERDWLLESKEFAYFPRDSGGYDAYLADMEWAQKYAYHQREAMMDALYEAVAEHAGDFEVGERINCHHNYAEDTTDGGLLTRKGAIAANKGQLGIIPGSMGAATYIVEGLGNVESYNSSPHGAGRIRGRRDAKRTLDLDEFRGQMAEKTWLDRDAEQLLDEAPGAYKPIGQVIEDSADLIEPVTVLLQFINYKGL